MSRQLTQRQLKGNLRHLPQIGYSGDFCSNDYLGFARSQELAKKIKSAAEQYEFSLHGATGSRLISGNNSFAELLEQELAEYFCTEACLLFNSGYAANQGLLSALLQRGDTVIYDELAHACIKDGCRLSPADRFSFRHNDLDHLISKLKRASSSQVLVVVESIYSMDGDAAPLAELVELCKTYGAGLVVDEAHSTGLWGPNGAGSCVSLGLGEEVLARVHTFGKALGTHGACVAGNKTLKEYLLNFSRTFIYTTALPAHSLISIREAVKHRKQHPELVTHLFRNVGLFHQLVQAAGPSLHARLLPNHSPIQAVLVPGNEQVRAVAGKLQDEGWGVWPILAPTVPEGQERLRICLHSYNTPEEMKELVQQLKHLLS